MDEKKPKEAAPKEREREKEKDDGKKSAAEQQAPKSNKMVFIGIIAAVIVVEIIAGIVIVKMAMPKPAEDHEAVAHADSLKLVEEESTGMGSTTAETPIEVVVNIAGTDGERFLKAAVVLEYEEKGEKKEVKKEGGHGGHGGGEGGGGGSPIGSAIKERMPKYKSYLIENLSKMSLAEITSPDAKEKIRKDFLRMVNGTLPRELGEVRDIYFTQFIIQ
jgi:flagellar basal body-associated protein FliL